MTLAFYAPMKAPDDPVPSGDRTIARAILAALRDTGATVDIASTLRSRDGVGDAAVQDNILQSAASEIDRCTRTGRNAGWQAWMTYHNYYKAPDLVGPHVASALNIPYVQIESTRARKRLDGPWTRFATAAEAATDAANVVFYFSSRDAISLRALAPARQKLVHLKPFLPVHDLPYASALSGPMISVGMMRKGDKLASYALIAETLASLNRHDWSLSIAGDGPERPKVEALMDPFGTQVRFLGELGADDLHQLYRHASLLFWPGVNEALGLVYLEAQAHGLAVVAQDRPGMRDVLVPGMYPQPEDGATGLAHMLADHLDTPVHNRKHAELTRKYIAQTHLLPTAVTTLREGLGHIGVTI